jgi:uncharacterized membrane protein
VAPGPDNREMLADIFGTSPTPPGMCGAGLMILVIGLLAAKRDVAAARGLDKIVALAGVCFAVPLAVFGALHLFGPQLVASLVPPYMPWRAFWAYAVGGALVAASLSIATRIGVRWSGLLFGIMMFLFVAMIHLPGALARRPYDRVIWTIVFREMSFGGAGWILAGMAMDRSRRHGSTLVTVGRVFVVAAMLVFGVEHFLHPTLLPGVPLVKQMPAWIPGRALIDYVTGAALLVAAGSVALNTHSRAVTACLGGWILLTIVVIYVPIMIAALAQPATPVRLEGINYFADTLLFAGSVLTLAAASSPARVGRSAAAAAAAAGR